jgi:hypothetical protein
MSTSTLEISGSTGVFAGVRIEVHVGQRITVGRSRFVELSAVKTPMAVRIGREKLEKNSGFRRMSRRHFDVAYEADDRVVIVDHSRNGVLLDGRRIEATSVLDPGTLSEGGATLRFGAGEELCLRIAR